MGYLTPAAREVFKFMRDNGFVTAGRAWDHLNQMPSGSLTRRITEIQAAGFQVKKKRAVNPVTERPYTRYSLAPEALR